MARGNSDPSWAQGGLRVRQECYLLGNRSFESCLSPLRFRCFLSITTEYTIRRTRRPVWVSRYDSHLGSHPAVLISDTLSSSRAFFLNLMTLVSFPPVQPLLDLSSKPAPEQDAGDRSAQRPWKKREEPG